MKHITFPLTVRIPHEICKVAFQLAEKGYEAYLVGGCVRDILLSRAPKDWDITTNASPEVLTTIFPHSHYDNIYGTVKVVTESDEMSLNVVEVTTYRTESSYTDKRHPDSVSFSDKLRDDLARRDFTVNALALPLHNKASYETMSSGFVYKISRETIIDYYDGVTDLENKTIRCVGNPHKRFDEDALRLMRAIRFSSQLSFSIEQETLSALTQLSGNISHVAKERITAEFSSLLLSDNPSFGLEIARRTNILTHIIPELLESVGIEQNQAHSFTVWEHLLRTLQASADKGWHLNLRLASLFHDIAKPVTRVWSKEKNDWTFHSHEVVGARMVKTILERFLYPKDIITTVTKLVRWHMFFSDTETITLSAVRRLVRNVGEENIQDLLKLRRADRIGTGRPKEQPYRFRKYASMIEEALRSPTSVSMLAINGVDIMQTFHVKPGPIIGYILTILLEEVLEDPTKNNKASLLEMCSFHVKQSLDDLKKQYETSKKAIDQEEEAVIKNLRSKYKVQ